MGDRDEQQPSTLSSALTLVVIISMFWMSLSKSLLNTAKSVVGSVHGLIESIEVDSSVNRMIKLLIERK